MILKNFAASPEGQELAVVCLDLGYKLANSAGELTRKQINFLTLAWNHKLNQTKLEHNLKAMKDGANG